SSNYILELLYKFRDSIKSSVREMAISWAPAPFSCDWTPTDDRIGLPQDNFLQVETKCPCGYKMKAVKNCAGELRLLEEEGSFLCRNKFGRGSRNYRVTKYYDDNLSEIKPVIRMEGHVELYYKGATIKLDFNNSKTILATDKWEIDHSTLVRVLKRHTGAGYHGAYLGEKPNYKHLIERDCATITKDKVCFLKMKRGCAFTYDLSLHNLTRLIELVHKNNLEDKEIPAVTVTTWLAYTFVNEDIGTIKPAFGEKVTPEMQEEITLQPAVVVDTTDVTVTVVGEAPTMTTGETPTAFTSSGSDPKGQQVLKLGVGEGQYPGTNPQRASLHEAIQGADERPSVLILGSDKATSNRVKTAKNVKVYRGRDPLEVRDMMRRGKILVIALSRVDNALLKFVDYKGTFLTRETLEALSLGRPKKKNITKAEAQWLLCLEDQMEELPDWFAAGEPIFLEANIKHDRYHLVGDIANIKEKAKQLGATDSTKISKEVGAKVYSMKL
nr:nonstructural protein NS5A [Classical swine fever virus]